METELAEMKECVARIDERTQVILDHQEKQVEALDAHEERDRQDFKEVHDRITGVEKKQQWIIGLGTAVIFTITIIGGFFKGFFSG